jgi:hypothetical protein
MNMYMLYNLMKLMNLSILRIRGGTLRRVKIIPSVRKLLPALRFGVGGGVFAPPTQKEEEQPRPL